MQISNELYRRNYNWGQDRKFMITSRIAGPIYWSLGDDLTSKDAQRFIGRAFEQPGCFSPPANNPGIKQKGILDASQAA